MALRRCCSTAARACRRATSTRSRSSLAGVFSPILYQQRGLLPTTDRRAVHRRDERRRRRGGDRCGRRRARVDRRALVGRVPGAARARLQSGADRRRDHRRPARRTSRGDGGVRQAARGTPDRRGAGAVRGDRSEGGGGHVDRRGVDGGAPHGLAVVLRRSVRRLLRCRTSSSWCRRSRGRWRRCDAHAEAETLVRGLPARAGRDPGALRARRREPDAGACVDGDSAELIPHAEVEVIEGAGHFIWHERPDEVRDVVRAFVARSSS